MTWEALAYPGRGESTASERIRLRAIEPEDAIHFHHWNSDPERARHLDFLWPPTSLESVRRWTTEMAQRRFTGEDYHWVIENDARTPVGSISTHHVEPRHGTFHLAFDVARDHRRRGYASAAIGLVVRWYFDELRYQKAVAVVYSTNVASLALHDRLGFVREGCLRRMVYQNGAYHDKIVFGMTREEFHECPWETRLRPSP